MATLWETITGNSTLPVQPGNNLYGHLLNQQGGAGTIVVEAIVETTRIDIDATVEPLAVEAEVDLLEYDVAIGPMVEANVKVNRTEIAQ